MGQGAVYSGARLIKDESLKNQVKTIERSTSEVCYDVTWWNRSRFFGNSFEFI
jgi:hypothetical protein